MNRKLINSMLVGLILMSFTSNSQPFYETKSWVAFIADLGNPEYVIAISNANGHCYSDLPKKRLVMVVYKLDTQWYTQVITIGKKKLEFSYREMTTISNEQYLNSSVEEVRRVFRELCELRFETTGPYIQLYFRDKNEEIKDSYVSNGDRGDINSYLNSEHEVVFMIYSLINNNCFY